MKLEAVVIPVSDVDRANEFYGRLGWRLDADFHFDNGFRVVQFTPPGSGCSVQFGTNITSATPRLRSAPQATWPARFGVRRPPTASTRSAAGQQDANWPDWYAEYMVREQSGEELPQ